MKLLGIDFGKKKIGVAFSEGFLPTPLAKVTVHSYSQAIKEIVELCNRLGVEKIIIGLPGGILDKETKLFGEKLLQILSLPIEFVDETLSTYESNKQLTRSNVKQKKRKELEDSVAASLILGRYLENKEETTHNT